MLAPRSLLLTVMLIALTLVAGTAPAAKQEQRSAIEIEIVESRLENAVYIIDASVAYDLGDDVLEALDSGVPITLELEIEVQQPRELMWNKTVYSLYQRYRINYHALSDQYLVTNLTTQISTSFPTSYAALQALGEVRELPLIDQHLLQPDQEYLAQMRASIVITELPAPLKLWAFLQSDWRESSNWYIWQLQ